MGALSRSKVFKSTIAALVGAAMATPALAEESCFARDYGAEHMTQNAGQLVSSLRVLFDGRAREAGETGIRMQVAAKFKDDPGTYLTQILICERDRTRLLCGVECDGGTAAVTWNGRHEVKLITKEFMVDGGCSGGNPRAVRELGADVTSFSLTRAKPAACAGMSTAVPQ